MHYVQGPVSDIDNFELMEVIYTRHMLLGAKPDNICLVVHGEIRKKRIGYRSCNIENPYYL